MEYRQENIYSRLAEPIANYCHDISRGIFENAISTSINDIRVIELFAGVGGFRIGLEMASKRFKTVWNNQWEPSTKRQDASLVYTQRFGIEGHSNQDIATVPTDSIPDADLLVGGFPCQDYSVASTLKKSAGIEGKKGVLWWQIYRILNEKANKPRVLFLENVDRLLNSPAQQRGRDFAIILASLADLGYRVEWRIINAADYGMPQRRRRTYILAYLEGSTIAEKINQPNKWLLKEGIMARAFPVNMPKHNIDEFDIIGDLKEVSDTFNATRKTTPFENTGLLIGRHVFTIKTTPSYNGNFLTLGDILIDETDVPEEYFIAPDALGKWRYLKGGKKEQRVDKTTGHQYLYSEGGMAFPDYIDRPSRTIITGEGGSSPSRFKHVVITPSGRYRRLTPIELERLNMFPDNHTREASDSRRAFLMGNALVTGIVEKIGVRIAKEL